MEIKITGRAEYGQYAKILVYGMPGHRKTLLGSTAKDALFLSIEAGLMTIADRGVPFKEIFEPVDLQEAFAFLRSGDHKYRWVIVDTLDELQKVFIADRLKRERREAMSLQDWGYVGEQMQKALRAYRNLPMNVVFLCHAKTETDNESGLVITKPLLQGAIGDQISGFMDLSSFISADVVKSTESGEPETTVTLRFQASPRFPHIKDRSGKMPDFYKLNLDTDLEDIYKLIFGGKKLPKGTSGYVDTGISTTVPGVVSYNNPSNLVVDGANKVEAEILAPKVPIDPPKAQQITVHSAEELLKEKLGATVIGTIPNCSECGTPVADQDLADLSNHRYEKVLCQEHFEEANKKNKKR